MKRLLPLAAFCLAALAPNEASALPVFSCDATTVQCNGLTYAVTYDGQFGAQQQYSLYIKTSTDYTGLSTDLLNAVALSGLDGVSASSNAQLVDAPGGVANWDFSLKELNASACSGGGTNSLCTEFSVVGQLGYAVVFDPSTIYQWSFRYDKTGANDPEAHIKYQWVLGVDQLNAQGKVVKHAGDKTGDLGSWDIDVQGPTPNPRDVPDSGATLSLLGISLAAFGIVRRRFM